MSRSSRSSLFSLRKAANSSSRDLPLPGKALAPSTLN